MATNPSQDMTPSTTSPNFPRTDWTGAALMDPPFRPIYDQDQQILRAAYNASMRWVESQGPEDENGLVLAVVGKVSELLERAREEVDNGDIEAPESIDAWRRLIDTFIVKAWEMAFEDLRNRGLLEKKKTEDDDFIRAAIDQLYESRRDSPDDIPLADRLAVDMSRLEGYDQVLRSEHIYRPGGGYRAFSEDEAGQIVKFHKAVKAEKQREALAGRSSPVGRMRTPSVGSDTASSASLETPWKKVTTGVRVWVKGADDTP